MTSMQLMVKSSGSAEPALDFVAAEFHKVTGHAVKIAYSADIEDFDVLVASRDAIERKFLPSGKVEQGGISIGRMVFGVAVRPGAAIPDISTMAAFTRALFETTSILVTKNHTSGIYIESVLKKMGLYEQVEPKIERLPNGPLLMDRVLAGNRDELGFLSVNAIRTYVDKGLVLVGALPQEIQQVREFVAVPSAKSRHKDIAREFVRFCDGPGKPILAAYGFL